LTASAVLGWEYMVVIDAVSLPKVLRNWMENKYVNRSILFRRQ
jgi:hypothetical protein